MELMLTIVFYSGLLHNYPSSIVALSLLVTITSNTFIIDQIKSVLLHKKDPSHYLVSQQRSHSSFIFSLSLSLFDRHNYYIAQLNFKVTLHNHDLIDSFSWHTDTTSSSTVIYEQSILISHYTSHDIRGCV